jgi:hypothetical protein
MVYAYSSQNPGSSASDATIVQHDDNSYGSSQVDLSKPIASTGQIQSQSASQIWTRYDSLIVIHGTSLGIFRAEW